jgi:Protein of unknown function (DUF1571)
MRSEKNRRNTIAFALVTVTTCWLGRFATAEGPVKLPPEASDSMTMTASGGASAATFIPEKRVDSESSLDALAKSDPVAFIRYCRDQYVRNGDRDYTCLFSKQERVSNRLGRKEKVDVRYRDEPFSVHMRWLENPTAASEALYVKNAWRDKNREELAWFKPKGALIRLIVPKIQQPIHGARAKRSARRTIDQFGFRSTLNLILKYVDRGLRRGELTLAFVGDGRVDGRPTWVFERQLPYTGNDKVYPDGLLRFEIDKEWLVPTSCFAYADSSGKKLLGSYEFSDVRFDVGLTADDFDPRKVGF